LEIIGNEFCVLDIIIKYAREGRKGRTSLGVVGRLCAFVLAFEILVGKRRKHDIVRTFGGEMDEFFRSDAFERFQVLGTKKESS
jgi:hypothetical protein